MANEITITAQDDLTREQGHARLVIGGLSGVDASQLSVQSTTFSLRRSGFTEPNLSDSGWQVAEISLQPVAIEFDSGNVVLVVGPNIVEAIEPFSTLSFSLQLPGQPVAETTLLWPDITPPIMRRGADGRALGEAVSEAPVVKADDTQEKARAAKLAELEEERKQAEEQKRRVEAERQAEEKRLADEREIEAAQRALEEERRKLQNKSAEDVDEAGEGPTYIGNTSEHSSGSSGNGVLGSVIKLVGAIFIGWGLLDYGLDKGGIDLYGELGITLPQLIWIFSAWISEGIGIFLYATGVNLNKDGEETEEEKSFFLKHYSVIGSLLVASVVLSVILSGNDGLNEVVNCNPPPPDTYSGECEAGEKNGYGKYLWGNGDRYVGNWKDDNAHGQGTAVFGSDVYKGIWKNGCFNERGMQAMVGNVSKEDCQCSTCVITHPPTTSPKHPN
jgi:hypothetical protein